MKYSELNYKRIKIDEFKNYVDNLIIEFNNSSEADIQINIIEKYPKETKKNFTHIQVLQI